MSATGRTSRGTSRSLTSRRGTNLVSSNKDSILDDAILDIDNQMLINIPIDKYKDLIHLRKGYFMKIDGKVCHFLLNFSTNTLTLNVYSTLTNGRPNFAHRTSNPYSAKVTYVSLKLEVKKEERRTIHRERNQVLMEQASSLHHKTYDWEKNMLIDIPIKEYKDLIQARKGCRINNIHFYLDLQTNKLEITTYNDNNNTIIEIAQVTHVSIKYGEPIAGGKHKKITKNMKSVKRGKKKGKKREKQTKKR